jgi:hypothetical protein
MKAEKKFHFGAIAQLMGVTYDNVALNATLFGEIKNHQLGIGSHYDFFNLLNLDSDQTRVKQI